MLFAVPAPPVVAEPSDSDAVTQQVEHRVSAMNKIHDVLAMVHPSACVHWLSDGEWSAHDLLLGLLQLSGPADVWLSSYGMSEYPARLMADLKTRGIIKRLICIIDSRIDKRAASALALVRNCATELKLVNTHAKVTIIENDTTSFCIIGSANYTTNRRYEAGIIIADRAVSSFHKKWIQDAIDKAE